MRTTLFRLLACLFIALSAAAPSAGLAASPWLSEYHEDFSTTAARESSEQVEWNTGEKVLRLEPLGSGQVSQGGPRVVTAPDGGAIVVWSEDRIGMRGIFAQRFSPDGARIWPQERLLVEIPPASSWMGYDVTTLPGGDFVLAWQDASRGNYDVYARRFNPQAQPVWGSGVRVNTDRGSFDQFYPAVASTSNGTTYVVWTDARQGDQMWQIFAQRLDSSGGHIWETDIKVSPAAPTSGSWHTQPSAAVVSGDRLVVAWQYLEGFTEGVSEDYEKTAALVQMLNTGGSRVWADQVYIEPVVMGEFFFNPAVVTSPGGGAVVVWHGVDFAGLMGRKLNLYNGEPDWIEDRMLGIQTFNFAARYGSSGQFLVAYEDEDKLMLRRFTGELQPTAAAPVELAAWKGSYPDTGPFSLSGAPAGSLYLAWEVPDGGPPNPGPSDSYLLRVSEAGEKLWDQPAGLVADEYIYQPSGTVTSLGVDTTDKIITRARLDAVFTGRVEFWLSSDGGGTWEPAVPGVELAFRSPGSDLRWRIRLTAGDYQSTTPVVSGITVRYGEGEIDEPQILSYRAILPLVGR